MRFLALIGMSGIRKAQIIQIWLNIEIILSSFDKNLFFETTASNMIIYAREIENFEFAQIVNFDFDGSL